MKLERRLIKQMFPVQYKLYGKRLLHKYYAEHTINTKPYVKDFIDSLLLYSFYT